MADRIQKTAEGKTTIKLPSAESIKKKAKQVDYAAKAFKDLRQVELEEFREAKAKQRAELRERNWVMHSEMANFLSHAAHLIVLAINSMRGDLPPRVKIVEVGEGKNFPVEIAEVDGELYAISRIRFNRETGNGWGYSVDPSRSWEYHSPNGLGSWGPPRNGADLISLYNNGWDTGGKVIYYKKRYSYVQNSGERKKNFAKSNRRNGKAYRHTYRNGRTGAGKVKYVTRSKKDPLHFVTDIVENGIDVQNGVSVFLNDYLYTVSDERGIYRSGLSNNISPWDYEKDYFLDQPF